MLGPGEISVENMIRLLQRLPAGTRMIVRSGDNAYVPKLRVWSYGNEISATIEPDADTGYHYNYPEGYSGVKEITADVGK